MRRVVGAWAGLLVSGCLDRGAAASPGCLRGTVNLALSNHRIDELDVLLVLDDSPALRPRAASLQRSLAALADAIVHPVPEERFASVHIAVVSSDLGAPRGDVAGCTGAGHDGRLNPRTCPRGSAALPSFLWFDVEADETPWTIDDVVCATDLGTTGCPIQQPLEAAYRALIERDAREYSGNLGPNAGFVRPDAVLAIVVVAPHDDASVRHCRQAEPGVACDEVTGDPLWELDRYLDPRHPARGFTGLKPGRPERVVFTVATTVPLEVPRRDENRIDWDALLAPVGDGPPVPRRLVGVARRFADTYANGWVTSIERDDLTGLVRPFLQRIQSQVWGRCLSRVLPTRSGVSCCDATGLPAGCVVAPGCNDPTTVAVTCEVIERLGASTVAADWCTAAHGRHRLADRGPQAVCRVDQIATRPGETPPRGAHGFYYDTTPDPTNPGCGARITFTRGDTIRHGSAATIECVLALADGC